MLVVFVLESSCVHAVDDNGIATKARLLLVDATEDPLDDIELVRQTHRTLFAAGIQLVLNCKVDHGVCDGFHVGARVKTVHV